MAAPSPLDQASAELRSARFVVHQLHQTFDSFQLHSSSILSLAEQWRNLQASFATVYESLDGKIKDLESMEREVNVTARKLENSQQEVELKRKKLEGGEISLSKKIGELQLRQNEVKRWSEVIAFQRREISERSKAVEAKERELFEGLRRVEKVDEDEIRVRKVEVELNERCREIELERGRVTKMREELEGRQKRIDELCKAVELRENGVEECRREVEVREREVNERLNGLEVKEKKLEERIREVELQEGGMRELKKEGDELYGLLEMRRKQLDERVKTLEGEQELKARELELKVREQCEGLRLKEIDVNERLRVVEVREKELRDEWGAMEEKEEGINRRLECVEEREKEVEKLRRGVKLKEKQVNERVRTVDVKEREMNTRIEAVQAKEKNMNELSKVLEAKEKQLNERSRVAELKEKQVQGLREEVELKEKRMNEGLHALELKKKQIDERCKALELKENEFSERCNGIDLKEKQLNRRCKAQDFREKQAEERSKGLEFREKEVDDRCQMLEQKEKQGIELSQALESKQREAKELSQALDSKDKQISELCQALDSKEKQIRELSQALELKERRRNVDFGTEQNTFCSSKTELKGKQMADESRNVVEQKEDQISIATSDLKVQEPKQMQNADSKLVVNNSLSENGTSMLGAVDGRALQIYLNERADNHSSIRGEVIKVLNSSGNPAKLVLEAVDGFFPPHLSKDGIVFKTHVVRSTCLLLLELLMDMKLGVSKGVRKEAGVVMMTWRSKMRAEGESAVVALGILLLVVVYNLNSHLKREELRGLCNMVDQHKLAQRLRQRLGFLKRDTERSILPHVEMEQRESNSVLLASAVNSSSPKISGDIHSLCRSMDATGVILYLIEHLQGHNMLHDKIFDALKYAVDPARLVLNVCQLSVTDLARNQVYAGKLSCIFLLILLMKLSPIFAPEVRDEAKNFAAFLKPDMSSSNNRTEHFRFLQFLAAYKLASCYSEDELLSHFNALYRGAGVFRPEHNTYLCFALGLSKKIPGVIKSLIDQQKLVLAVKYICCFKLESNFPPVPLLEACLELAIKEAEEKLKDGTLKSKVDAANLESLALADVIDCVRTYKLESKLPIEPLSSRIKELNEQRVSWYNATKCLKKRKANPSSYGSDKAQRGKHPRQGFVQQTQPGSPNYRPPFARSWRHSTRSQTYISPPSEWSNPLFSFPGGHDMPAVYPGDAQYYPLL